GPRGADAGQRGRGALRLAAHSQIRLLIDQVGQPFPHQGVIVHEEHPGPSVRVHGLRISQMTVVPPEGSARTSNVPPMTAARWAMMRSPIPWPRDSGFAMPTPLSCTVSRTLSGAPSRRITIRRARPCLIAFVI